MTDKHSVHESNVEYKDYSDHYPKHILNMGGLHPIRCVREKVVTVPAPEMIAADARRYAYKIQF